MIILRTISEMKSWSKDTRGRSEDIGFVPTMGYLHEGHLSLVDKSSDENGRTVVSIFVNPAQFGPNEDLARYPRDYEGDSAKLRAAGVDALFYPEATELYPTGYQTFVDVEKVSAPMCGASRPGHFRGVATIVLKLLNIVNPDRAYFGLKDFQQFLVISSMAKDLNLDTRIVGCPIVRESDGLAMSSRNSYLSPAEHRQATSLYDSLVMAKQMVAAGESSSGKIMMAVRDRIAKEHDAVIDYAKIVDPVTLEDLAEARTDSLLALAVRIGKTRLIDNMILG